MPDNMMTSICLSSLVYERQAIVNASHKFSEAFHIHIDLENDQYKITFKAKAKGEESIDKLQMFTNEVLEQQVRLDLNKQFGNLRDLIYQKAFSVVEVVNAR